jgi:hypothetical protein
MTLTRWDVAPAGRAYEGCRVYDVIDRLLERYEEENELTLKLTYTTVEYNMNSWSIIHLISCDLRDSVRIIWEKEGLMYFAEPERNKLTVGDEAGWGAYDRSWIH